MKRTGVVSAVFIFLICLVENTFGCNGYQLKINNIKNCGSEDVIKLQNFNVLLDKDCNVVSTGCVIITKPFKTAMIHYTVKKPPMPDITGHEDMCKIVRDKKNIAKVLSDLSFPHRCPVKAQKLCTSAGKKYNISKYKNQLGLAAGNIKLKLEGQHDSGSTCLEFDIDLRKGK